MTRPNKFVRAVAKREADAAAPATGDMHTTKQTFTFTRHLHHRLVQLLADLKLQHRLRKLPLGPVGVTLFEIFADDPELQKEVIRRLT